MVLLEEVEVPKAESSESSAAAAAEGKAKATAKPGSVSDAILEKKAQSTRIKLEKLSMFAEQLASMLQAGLPLSHALDTLVAEIDDKVFHYILLQIKDNIFSGSSFSDSLRMYPRAFPPLFYNMVEAGEVSGVLPDAMNTVAGYLNASVKLTKKFKSALTYPIVIITMSSLLVMGLMIWVVPVFGEMFSGFGASLPWLTQALIDCSNYMQANVLWIVLGLGTIGFGGKRFIDSPNGKKFLDITLRYLPLLGTLVTKTNIARFCRTYSVLLENGVPILKTIDICSNVVDSYYVTSACTKIKKGIESGQQLSSLMETIPYFPKIVCNMAKAGEQAGNVEKMIGNVAVLFEHDVNNMVAALTSLLEPFIICFLGIVIGVIVIAMFLPIFQLSSLVG